MLLMTFKKWLSKFVNVELPIGDLAREFSEKLPETNDYDVLSAYFDQVSDYQKSSCFQACWEFYAKTSKPLEN